MEENCSCQHQFPSSTSLGNFGHKDHGTFTAFSKRPLENWSTCMNFSNFMGDQSPDSIPFQKITELINVFNLQMFKLRQILPVLWKLFILIRAFNNSQSALHLLKFLVHNIKNFVMMNYSKLNYSKKPQMFLIFY